MSTVTVVGRAVAKPGKRDELERRLRAVIVPTHAEEESIHYSMHQDLDDPDVFLAIERWPGRDALERHLGTPHLTELAGLLDDLLAEPLELRVLGQLHEGDSPKGVL
ncbi:putative quinol monooxygenase [Kitasatospora sp. DSM 101779]|uniref:putative quinol monooxygenase n=1 Tax=Kitasatospora sp. DSM 101779 TaxID=2853165 RepID=UPI0021DA3A17|nr:putative quinol monooxygenase [Kitasatospora sp. DSM 101779]MCU7821884.1 antibiotic biosynthesis monooxygenase [Kitasatospora sp. DSM 101779]